MTDETTTDRNEIRPGKLWRLGPTATVTLIAPRAPDRHIIARRAVMGRDADHWRPMAGAAMSVAAARDAYDAGTIEMAQGRDGDEMVLYAIPRRVRIVRVAWFGRRTDIPPHKVTLRGVV